ncbi:MAG: helix-turn-helix domain-containing protein [Burkholderiaceae bacterium]|nr:MAG: helix-turn-helix domain-containing protein [Burkholderiaceae bacterium]TBR76760.1 MAG: helix-turn-helix domain-containing protein [Burkholderiaceae bacterium]
MNLAEIGLAVRDARRSKGLTLQVVAKDLGMGIATLSRLERGDLDGIGARSLLRVVEYVGLQLVTRQQGHGMTLSEAQEDAASMFNTERGGPSP